MSDIVISSATDDEIVVLKEGVALETILQAVTDSATAQTAAETAQAAAETAKTGAETAEANAGTQASTATTQAGIATTQATNAFNSATAAATSETNAGTSETNAAASASAASTSETNAAASAVATAADVVLTNADVVSTNADAAQTSSDLAGVQALYDAFDDRYLGSKANDPTLDNDGNSLVDGALYFNTSTSLLKVYDLGTTTWVSIPQTSIASSTDVTLTSLTTGEILSYDGTKWINQTLAELEIVVAPSGVLPALDGSNLTNLPSQVILTQPTLSAETAIVEGVQLDITITNYDANVTYVVVGTNCTAVESGGTISVTNPTTATPSFTVQATMAGWDGEDSAVTTRNLTTTLATPTLTPPADSSINTDVTYAYTVSDNSDTFVLNLGTTDYTYVGVTGGTLVSDSSGVITVNGITGTSVTITVQFTVAATYSSVNGTSSDSAGNWTTSATSANDEIVIDAGVVVQTNFEVATYDGNGGTQTINLGVINTGVDFVWIKRRSTSQSHGIFDSVRGNNNRLYTDLTNAEVADSLTFSTSSIDIGNTGNLNASSEKFVAWCASLPTDASYTTENGATIASTTKSNDFMSAISYVGAGVTDTIVNHGLGGVPELILIKNRSIVSDWIVGHKDLGANWQSNYLQLNTTSATLTNAIRFSQDPTSTTFTLDFNTFENGSTNNMIAYCFTSVAGKCKVGSYNGTGLTGNAVDCGFEPAWVMIKRTNTTGNWLILDNSRISGTDTRELYANVDGAEETSSLNDVNFTTTGFSVDGTSTQSNTSGSTYIYLAIAKNPVRSPKTFDTELYTGNGSTQTINMSNITDGVDLSWIKIRDTTYDHYVFDSIRGVGQRIFTDTTAAEVTDSDTLTSFNASSIDLGADVGVNQNTNTFVSWNFSCPNHTASNTDGTITSETKHNDYMSIVSWSSSLTGSQTKGHSLGRVPELIIIKNRDAADSWYTKATVVAGFGVNGYLKLDTTDGLITTGDLVSAGTTTTFTTNDGLYSGSGGQGIIAYCFASVNGVCKIGSYTGTGADNTISCGFEPAFVLVKCSSNINDWGIFDNDRGVAGTDAKLLKPNTSDAETNTTDYIDFTSDGFTMKGSAGFNNDVGKTYIYLAIAVGA